MELTETFLLREIGKPHAVDRCQNHMPWRFCPGKYVATCAQEGLSVKGARFFMLYFGRSVAMQLI